MIVLDLGQVASVKISPTPPTNTKLLWYDVNQSGSVKFKVFDETLNTWKLITDFGNYTLPNDIQVKLTNNKTFGKYKNNDVIPGGLNAIEIIEEATLEVIAPSFILPTTNLSVSPSNSLKYEVGQSLNITLNSIFNQNDGGSPSNFQLRKNSVLLSTSTLYVDNNVIIQNSPIVYSASFNYSAGNLSKTDELGNVYPNNIAAGQATDIKSFMGYYKIFYGATNSIPLDGVVARTLPQNQFENDGNVFNLNTGNTNKIFVIVLPPGKNLVSVEDLDALGLNITSEYELINSNFVGKDANNENISGCKLYAKVSGIPYTTNHRHRITLN